MSTQNLICREVEVHFCKHANIFNFRVESMTASEIRARDTARVPRIEYSAQLDIDSVPTLEDSLEGARILQPDADFLPTLEDSFEGARASSSAHLAVSPPDRTHPI